MTKYLMPHSKAVENAIMKTFGKEIEGIKKKVMDKAKHEFNAELNRMAAKMGIKISSSEVFESDVRRLEIIVVTKD